MTIPDHFLWIDRAEVISAWIVPLAWAACIAFVALAVIAICVIVVKSDQSPKKDE